MINDLQPKVSYLTQLIQTQLITKYPNTFLFNTVSDKENFIPLMKVTLVAKQRPQIPTQQLSQQISQLIRQIYQYESTVRKNLDCIPIYYECQTNYVQVCQNLLSGIKALKIAKTALDCQKGNRKMIKMFVQIYMSQFAEQNFYQLNKYEQVCIILELENMLKIFTEFFYQILYYQDDIASLPKKCYPQVWDKIKINSLGNSDKIKNQQDLLKKAMHITSAAMISQAKYQNHILKTVTFGLAYPTYFLNYQLAKLKNATMCRNPSVQQVKAIWNLPQNATIKLFKTIVYDKIDFRQQLYFPQHCPSQQQEMPDIHTKKQQSNIKVILINHKQLRSKFNMNAEIEYNQEQMETIMIYFHGGGFIALSSQTMQCYTRKWANELKIPIFAVQYRKPPQHRFPVALEDCFNAYQFIYRYIRFYYNVNPKKIILAGDSAGGNLACSLTGLILKFKLPPIHSLFLAYPAVDLRKRFSPSFINSFEQAILHPNLLLMCMSQYLQNVEQNQNNPLASPILLSQQYCNGIRGNKKFPSNWPKTKIIVGKNDPLFDSSILLMQRMVESGVDCCCEIYSNFSHGFLNYQFIHTEISTIIDQSVESLKLMIK